MAVSDLDVLPGGFRRSYLPWHRTSGINSRVLMQRPLGMAQLERQPEYRVQHVWIEYSGKLC